ncbi:DUF4917 family protein [Rouxiella badensis]|uniref:DUF4917 family protein n=1 Tax=Rouxiella badensis TaxID=1646377 RepID=UPI0013EEF195|nr:DUF4917 family protein [Rouxiella badensis]QII37366.1 DUF4917 family protein [Rouxiella badensis]
MAIISFSDALQRSESQSKRHLLLGNGFSIACRPNIFSYGRLFEQADFSQLPASAHQVFRHLNTEDFEKVISILKDSARILNVYDNSSEELASRIKQDAESLREVLVQTLATNHPAYPGEITESEFECCKVFLKNFTCIYSLNYDLLLYWVCMHIIEDDEKPISDDGFRKPYGNEDANYVTWEPNNSRSQSLWFLHGALHLFDAGYELRKYTWKNTNIRLIDQIRAALKNELFPVFVSEGKSKEKVDRIRHNDYLAKASRSFSSISGALFIYGHSLAENDEHFLKSIEKGKVKQLYVGIYGDENSSANKKIIARATRMGTLRKKSDLDVFFFNAESAHVWS